MIKANEYWIRVRTHLLSVFVGSSKYRLDQSDDDKYKYIFFLIMVRLVNIGDSAAVSHY